VASRAPLTVETDLELTIDGARVDVRSTGERLFVDFPSLPALARAARGLPQTRVTEAAAVLVTTDLTVEFRARGRTVAAMGADAPAGPLSQWLGLAPVQIRAGGVAAAISREVGAGVRVLRALLG
jgi:hypothetical protein